MKATYNPRTLQVSPSHLWVGENGLHCITLSGIEVEVNTFDFPPMPNNCNYEYYLNNIVEPTQIIDNNKKQTNEQRF